MPVLKLKIILLPALLLSLSIKAQSPVEISNQVFSYLKKEKFDKIDALFDTTGIIKFVTAPQKSHYKEELAVLGKPKKLIRIDEEPHGFKTNTAIAIEFKKEKKMLYINFNCNKIEYH
jgi:hypothetical protein